jgi:UDP-GlcNAc:undecaprenyl-phosphate GlcNAc-1-phosphate transferase
MIYLRTFAAAFLSALVLTPVIRAIALRARIMDIPNDRSLHALPIPKTGGIAIYFAFALPVIWLASKGHPLIFSMILAASIVLLVGFLDDLIGISPASKMAGQALAGLVLIGSGIKIGILPDVISIPLTLFWLVGVTNAVNLLDGMDGMAAGVSAIAASFFMFLAVRSGEIPIALVSVALAGACLGFLRFNFHKASVFMGDTGSMFLGFVLASLGVMSTFKSGHALQLFAPVIVLGIPVFDTSLAVLRRLWKRRPLFTADCDHFYEWLCKQQVMGYRSIVVMTYGICLILGLGALFMGGI